MPNSYILEVFCRQLQPSVMETWGRCNQGLNVTSQQVIVFLLFPEDVLLLIVSLQHLCPFFIFSETFAAVIINSKCAMACWDHRFSSPPLRFVLPLSVTSCLTRFWQQAICLSTIKETICCNTSRSQLIRMMWMSTKQVKNVVSLILAMTG